MKTPIVIATRGSELALWQAKYVQQQLEAIGLKCELKIIRTKGDDVQHLSFDKMEGKGFFTKEIEDALLQNEADIAVHSHKDLETTAPEGLTIAAVSNRASAAEFLLIQKAAHDEKEILGLKKSLTVGTSSVRRKSQLKSIRPDLVLKDLRGNVPTRIEKLRSGEYDAILIAKAGVERLGLQTDDLIAIEIPVEQIVPAPAQGALAVQCRSDDKAMIETLRKINHQPTEEMTNIERSVLQQMDGGCQLPLGVFAKKENEEMVVEVAYCKNLESNLRRLTFTGNDAKGLIEMIVRELKNK